MIGFAHLAAWLLITLVLAVSAASKLRSRAAFSRFADSVRRVHLVPARLARPAAAVVALAEAAAVALLVAPPLATAGLALAAVLLAAFTVVVAVAIARGVQAPCRCFGGASERPYGPAHLVRNVLLMAVVAFALWSDPPSAYDAGGVAVAVFAAVAGTLVIVFLVDFVSLFAPGRPPGGQTPAATRRTTA